MIKMNWELLIVVLISMVISIAMSSIGIQFFNDCKSGLDNDKYKNNKKYLIWMLVLSIFVFLGVVMFGLKKHPKTSAMMSSFGPSSLSGSTGFGNIQLSNKGL
jgi:hypothetical protein